MSQTSYRNAFVFSSACPDGQVTKNEVTKVMREINEEPNHEEIEEILQDSNNKGGSLQMADYMNLVNNRMRDSKVETTVFKAFRNLDVNNSGLIRNEDFKMLFTLLGNNVNEEAVDDFVFAADPDGDGFINYKEFLRNNFKS